MSHSKPVNVYLNPQAVRELIKLDEPAMVALAHNATEQIANALRSKLTKQVLDQRLTDLVSDQTADGWYPTKIKPRAEALLVEFLKERSDALVDKIANDTIKDVIREHVVAELQLKTEIFRARMINEIDDMLRTRFAAMFGTPISQPREG